MKTKFVLFFLIFSTTINSQELLNGNLEGTVMGFTTLPDHWESIPYTDINCQADMPINATPDLTSIDAPGPDFGIFGHPYSGNTFISGNHAQTLNDVTFQEGIMQTVSGFQIGTEYNISFYQSVFRGLNCNDKSGSWMFILNDSIIGISDESVTDIEFDDPNLEWEFRSFSFIAFEEELTLKFIPWDGDGNLLCDFSENGGLGMAMDKITLEVTTNTDQISKESRNVVLYPNPNFGFLNLDVSALEDIHQIRIQDADGKLVYMKSRFENLNNIEISFDYPPGIYYITIADKFGVVRKKFVKL